MKRLQKEVAGESPSGARPSAHSLASSLTLSRADCAKDTQSGISVAPFDYEAADLTHLRGSFPGQHGPQNSADFPSLTVRSMKDRQTRRTKEVRVLEAGIVF